MAASMTAAGSPANVITLRWWSASASKPRRTTLGTAEMAPAMAATIRGFRPSEKFGTHSSMLVCPCVYDHKECPREKTIRRKHSIESFRTGTGALSVGRELRKPLRGAGHQDSQPDLPP